MWLVYTVNVGNRTEIVTGTYAVVARSVGRPGAELTPHETPVAKRFIETIVNIYCSGNQFQLNALLCVLESYQIVLYHSIIM